MDQRAKSKFALKAGKLIKTAREKKTVSQEELAFRCNLDRSYIGHIENGRHVPSIYVIAIIALKLNVPVNQLIPQL